MPVRLSDTDLEAEVKRLAQCERETTATLIGHLAELYGRRLHERAGFTSLFTYCVEALGLSDSASYDRMKAAKVVRRYPLALELIVSGRLNLTTVRLLAPHLTRANHAELFAAAAGMRKRQVQKLVAERFPKPDVPGERAKAADSDSRACFDQHGCGDRRTRDAPRRWARGTDAWSWSGVRVGRKRFS